jgi:hypothetical protein
MENKEMSIQKPEEKRGRKKKDATASPKAPKVRKPRIKDDPPRFEIKRGEFIISFKD